MPTPTAEQAFLAAIDNVFAPSKKVTFANMNRDLVAAHQAGEAYMASTTSPKPALADIARSLPPTRPVDIKAAMTFRAVLKEKRAKLTAGPLPAAAAPTTAPAKIEPAKVAAPSAPLPAAIKPSATPAATARPVPPAALKGLAKVRATIAKEIAPKHSASVPAPKLSGVARAQAAFAEQLKKS